MLSFWKDRLHKNWRIAFDRLLVEGLLLEGIWLLTRRGNQLSLQTINFGLDLYIFLLKWLNHSSKPLDLCIQIMDLIYWKKLSACLRLCINQAHFEIRYRLRYGSWLYVQFLSFLIDPGLNLLRNATQLIDANSFHVWLWLWFNFLLPNFVKKLGLSCLKIMKVSGLVWKLVENKIPTNAKLLAEFFTQIPELHICLSQFLVILHNLIYMSKLGF